MEDGGNILIAQDCHLDFYQTKPEDGGWRAFLNCTGLPREPITKPNLKMEDGGNIRTVQDCHMGPVGTHSKVTKSLEKSFPMKLNINYLIIYTQSYEIVS
jgi:hypothetical protein